MMSAIAADNSFAQNGDNKLVFCQKTIFGIPYYVTMVNEESECFKRERAIIFNLGNGGDAYGPIKSLAPEEIDVIRAPIKLRTSCLSSNFDDHRRHRSSGIVIKSDGTVNQIFKEVVK